MNEMNTITKQQCEDPRHGVGPIRVLTQHAVLHNAADALDAQCVDHAQQPAAPGPRC